MVKKRKKRRIAVTNCALGLTREQTRVLIKRGEFLKKLMKEFDARLSAFDPGVMAIPEEEIDPKTSAYRHALSFQGYEWAWLEPLLIELRNYREGDRKYDDMRMR